MPTTLHHEFASLAMIALGAAQDIAKVMHGQASPPQAFAALHDRLLPFSHCVTAQERAPDPPAQAMLAATRQLQGAGHATSAELSRFLELQQHALSRVLRANGQAPSSADCRLLHGFASQLARAAGQLAHSQMK